jgi:PAS domain S-box-containing protein
MRVGVAFCDRARDASRALRILRVSTWRRTSESILRVNWPGVAQRGRESLRLAAWALAYLAAHAVGVAFADPVRHVGAIWPASGIGVAALLSTPRRRWPAMLAAIGGVGFVANALHGGALAMDLGFLAANAAEFALVVALVERVCRREISFAHVDEVLALAAATVAANMVVGLIGAGSPWLFGSAPFWPTYWTWCSTNVLGTILVTPFAIAWTRTREPGAPSRPLETVVFGIAWCAGAWITTHESGLGGPFAPQPYMLLCLVPWAALRLGLRAVTTAMLALGAVVSSAVLSRTMNRDLAPVNLADAMIKAQIYVGIASVTGLLLVARTSEARLAHAARSKSAAHFLIALEAAQMGTWEWDVASGAIHWSDRVVRMFGVRSGGFSGGFEDYLALIHPDDRAIVAAEIERALQHGSSDYNVEHRIVWPDGAVRWLACRGRVDRDALGKPTRMAGTVVDITVQQHVAERLRQTQKMEAIGQLAGGVAHDFNNILAAILTQAEVARRRAPAEDRPLLGEIIAATERGASLTQQLLAFARRQVLLPKPLDLNVVVTDIAAMLRRLLGDEQRMRVELSKAPLVTCADAGMLGQVLVNLALNSRDAMPDGGELTIATAETVVEHEDELGAPPGPYAMITVTDTGAGIAPEHLSRLFEPFFTTKPPGKGTGLGLATVFGIVKLHHGFVRVASEVGKGTSVEIFLPPTDEAIAVPSPRPAKPEPAGERETILLVEDDANLRKTTRMLFEMSGYVVVEARNGVEALSMWAEHGERIGLLFTDMTMPEGLDGRQLAAELRRRRPELKVILTSGYNSDLAGREVGERERFLMKPCPVPELLDAVRLALDS